LFKLDGISLALTSVIATMGGWTVSRLYKSADKAHSRIAVLEKSLVDRPYLESQLAPMRADINLILKTLLEKK
jgi:hypothetical protein